MLIQPSRRGTVRLLAGVTVLWSLAGVASAQQSGLLPLHPIRRERVPCPLEDPIYKLYRSQYYGYFPTQWRPFPQGWNLPSPEGPNTREALEKMPIEASAPPEPDEGEGDQGQMPDRGARPAPLPPPENERSPFEMDRPDNDNAAPGAGAAPRRPARESAPRDLENSPFDMPNPERPAAPRPRAPQPTSPAPRENSPDLAPPGPAGDAPPPRTSRTTRPLDDSSGGDPGPLLAMPDATLPDVEEAGSVETAVATLPSLPAASTPGSAAVPAAQPLQTQAPTAPRRGRIGSLFAGMGFNRLRR